MERKKEKISNEKKAENIFYYLGKYVIFKQSTNLWKSHQNALALRWKNA